MHFNLLLGGLTALAAVPGISARFVDGFPPATRGPLEKRQASATTADVQPPRSQRIPSSA